MAIYTVTQIANVLSAKLKTEPKFRGIAVKGELSDVGSDRSGHLYFRLKEGNAGLRGVMFSQNAAKLKFLPIEGMSVIAYGGIDYYQRDGSCEIVTSQLLPAGEGAEYLALAKLKEKLTALGVFTAPKKPIPRYPKSIAVVTSPNGAAIMDIKNIVSRRYPVAEIRLFPTLVQGISAPENIAKALYEADSSGCDTLILARGGGSSEDLSAFNAEAVVMAVYNCQTPIISAVGHETDWSLSDLAADLRAPTPSGAAELATPDITVMIQEINIIATDLKKLVGSRISAKKEELKSFEFALAGLSPKSKIKARVDGLKAIEETMESAKNHKLEICRIAISSLGEMLSGLNPENILSRGYAMVYKNGTVADSADKLSAGDNIKIVMRGGNVGAEVKKVLVNEDEL